MDEHAEANGSSEVPPEDAATAFESANPAPPETAEHAKRRQLIIVSFWAVVLFLGLPIWWKTTTVYRAALPLQQMLDWSDGKVCDYSIKLGITV